MMAGEEEEMFCTVMGSRQVQLLRWTVTGQSGGVPVEAAVNENAGHWPVMPARACLSYAQCRADAGFSNVALTRPPG